MGLIEAVRTCLSQYVTFTGRARRSEYWYWLLAVVVAEIVLSIFDTLIGTAYSSFTGGVITTIFIVAIILPSLAVAIRRLHDTGRTGWWVLLGAIPVVGLIVLLVFYAQDSGPDNEYGPSPKAVTA